MDFYNSWIAKFVLILNLQHWDGPVAITLGPASFFSCPKERVSKAWHAHEDCHKDQFHRDGALVFLVKYLWYSLRYGYEDNPYEVEACQAATAAEE